MQNQGPPCFARVFFFPFFGMYTESEGEGAPHVWKPVELVSRNFLELLEGSSCRVCEWWAICLKRACACWFCPPWEWRGSSVQIPEPTHQPAHLRRECTCCPCCVPSVVRRREELILAAYIAGGFPGIAVTLDFKWRGVWKTGYMLSLLVSGLSFKKPFCCVKLTLLSLLIIIIF